MTKPTKPQDKEELTGCKDGRLQYKEVLLSILMMLKDNKELHSTVTLREIDFINKKIKAYDFGFEDGRLEGAKAQRHADLQDEIEFLERLGHSGVCKPDCDCDKIYNRIAKLREELK